MYKNTCTLRTEYVNRLHVTRREKHTVPSVSRVFEVRSRTWMIADAKHEAGLTAVEPFRVARNAGAMKATVYCEYNAEKNRNHTQLCIWGTDPIRCPFRYGFVGPTRRFKADDAPFSRQIARSLLDVGTRRLRKATKEIVVASCVRLCDE